MQHYRCLVKWCSLFIGNTSKFCTVFYLLCIYSQRWNKVLHSVFSSDFSELIFVAVSVFLFSFTDFCVSPSLPSDLIFLFSLSLKRVVSNTDQHIWKNPTQFQFTHLENEVVSNCVYGLRTDKKIYGFRICTCQSSNKCQGFKSTLHLVTSKSNSGRWLWEKIVCEKKKNAVILY